MSYHSTPDYHSDSDSSSSPSTSPPATPHPSTTTTTTTTPATPQPHLSSSSSELNYLLTESGLYPSPDGKKKPLGPSSSPGHRPIYATGTAANTTTPGPHRRPNPSHPMQHQAAAAAGVSSPPVQVPPVQVPPVHSPPVQVPPVQVPPVQVPTVQTPPVQSPPVQVAPPVQPPPVQPPPVHSPPVHSPPVHPPAVHPAPPVLPSSPQYEVMGPTWRYDPLSSPDWDSAGPPGPLCACRVKKDLSAIFTEPLPGIFAVPQEDNLFVVHCLIVGPFDTPYEGGFFHFVVRFGPSYPIHPPRVRLLTTGGGIVRFNPNLYRNGKVCLSILGTWRGPAWSPAANLSSVLLSLQSLLNERPYHNEPGYEQERSPGDSSRYNTIITHETIRVSVVEQLTTLTPTTTPNTTPNTTTTTPNTTAVPSELRTVMETSFLEYYDHYVEVCNNNMQMDSQLMEDPFGEIRGRFSYAQILRNLRRLKIKIKTTLPPEPSQDHSPLTSDDDDDDDDGLE